MKTTSTAEAGFTPRRPFGSTGGRPVSHDFFFVRGDGERYPSESDTMLTSPVIIRPATARQSWRWALSYLASQDDLWLVVPIDPSLGDREQHHAATVIRASIWKSARRFPGYRLTSQFTPGRLWVRLVY